MLNRIRELRKAKKMSQEALANICDVSRQTINAIENNKYDPSLALAFKIATTLNITVDELFQFHSEKRRDFNEN
ncbi:MULTISPECIES: helix-turn-helix transcriptional regulator [Bacillaceae]|jgi:putative transcriptional regulator|uniref:Transcriptional regulator n=1 Tax=Shouchella clausii TaxID=79880 RepID=A0A268RUB3_SHOCL|nr:helix-turn-helix transcriptional regulator [Shouchella clausii]PAD40987.1 transcriptional regulator [Bacillus sp. 7520-S]HLR70995.1 helix-turn-helix transcriptional regulator [Pseudogracilibacillus sp.]MEB5480674.1 helix-turn-helix transcriptional regulator [Shouchella clausii]MED4161116.1 helix-turn-helix transcriptional regulator [Shouchella clausii]MED4179113.1 helix-turn-helix transcriptional regulator [Shouchella clausii]